MDFKSAHNINEKERSEDIRIEENVTFNDMYLTDSVLSGLNSCGFIKPSPIQLSAIPLGRCGLDLIVQAKSGTGKTCVFSVVALEMVCISAKTTQVLVIAPTREIAIQNNQVINSLASSMPGLKAHAFIGGLNIADDKIKLKCCHIATGTPGRLIQLVSLGCLDLKNVRLLVIDEADQLLSGQFKESILELVKTLPFNKQVLALSATYPPEVTTFFDKFMRSPTQVRLGKESPALIGVSQFARILSDHPHPHRRHTLKFKELLKVLSTVSFNQCLVFSNSQLRAESISNQLNSAGWPSSFLTGGQLQTDRLEAYFSLCSYKCRVLVSTDLSARGLDSEHVNLVINLDVPTDQATYLHRVGRSGRYGTKGTAISLVCDGEEWTALRAVATLTNVKIKLINGNYNKVIKKSENLNDLKYLNKNELIEWMEKSKKKFSLKNGANHNQSKRNTLTDSHKNEINGIKSNINGKIIDADDNLQATVEDLMKTDYKQSNDQLDKLLHDHLKESVSHNFSYEEIKKQLAKVKVKDHCEVTVHDFFEKNPSESSLENIESYVENCLATCTESLSNQMSNADIDNSLEQILKGVQSMKVDNIVINSSKHSDSDCTTNYSNCIKSDAIVASHDTSEFSNNNDLRSACQPENSIQDPSFLNIPEESIDATNDITAKVNPSQSIDTDGHNDKENVKKTDGLFEDNRSKPKKLNNFNENTGFGSWTPVTEEISTSINHKNLPNQVRSQISQESLLTTTKSKPKKSKSKRRPTSHTEKFRKMESYSECSSMSSSDDSWHTMTSSDNYFDYYNSCNDYIKSAQTFAMMMDYVQTMGRMSALAAYKYHKKSKTDSDKLYSSLKF